MMEKELGEGYSFIKKKCFVCGSLSRLIKDCDYYEKKMAREAEFKKQRVFNTSNRVAKPVWTNANRVNHANQFFPRPVQLNAGRPNINSVRPKVNTVSSNVNTVRSRQPVPTRTSNRLSPKRPQDHPLKNIEDKGIFDSGCLGHMTGNKDHLDDFEECKGGSVTFGGSKGYITGKGRIRVGNLDFDSVSFVKELGHFNLFSISQICDKQHKVLFTKTECLVVSPDFKMPDENQILLKVPRQHNMYSFDMKTHSLTKDYACLITKATSDESKLWHMRFSWVFFLATKDETSGILQNFIRQIENQLNHRVKIIRSDNGTEFKNKDMLEFYNTQPADQDDSDMPELTIFNKHQKGIFDEASYDDKGMVYDYNTLPIEVIPSHSAATFRSTCIGGTLKGMILVDLPSWSKVAQGHRPKDGIDYDEVFALVVRIEAIRSMIGSLMYLTASRPDITFAVCACSRFQVTPKTSHLNAMKRIFKYLKDKPNLSLWYPRESSFDLEAYSVSDYAGANLDRKSTTGGCQFLKSRLISWQCKKQTIVATSITEDEYLLLKLLCTSISWIQINVD
ncbi:putative ribonuclease H-like domain-containing protein [Tanacetum coccineum]